MNERPDAPAGAGIPPPRERTAADVADAPLPGHESGRIGPGERESVLRHIARSTLLIPRAAFEILMTPVRASVYAYERYQLRGRFKRMFFGPDEGTTIGPTYTYGLYPSINIDSKYGATLGGRLLHRNLFGDGERVSLGAAFGGEYRTQLDGRLRSGYRLGDDTVISVRGQYELRPGETFYGIGNADGALRVRHRQKMSRIGARIDVRLVEQLQVAATGALTDLELSRAALDEDGVPPIDEAYPPEMLTGWPETRNLYGELELRYDRRSRTTTLDQHATFDRGGLVSIYVGPLHQLEAGNDYWRYGGDAQAFIPLGPGPRVLAARLQFEAVTGGYKDVPFMQLPQLGGERYLRGYARDRFRDRVSTFGSLEYQWDLARMLMAGIFVDVGRVYPQLDDMAIERLRVGYGVTLQLHDNRRYLADISVATSKDGGVFAYFSFDPVFELEQRVDVR